MCSAYYRETFLNHPLVDCFVHSLLPSILGETLHRAILDCLGNLRTLLFPNLGTANRKSTASVNVTVLLSESLLSLRLLLLGTLRLFRCKRLLLVRFFDVTDGLLPSIVDVVLDGSLLSWLWC